MKLSHFLCNIVGWIVTLRLLADIFHIDGFYVLYAIMCSLMFVVWSVLFVLTVVAFAKGWIFNSSDEDVRRDAAMFFGGKTQVPSKISESSNV